MRKLMWLTVGFGAACTVSVWLLSANMLLAAFFCLAAFLTAGIFGRKHPSALAAALVLLGCSLGFAWFQGFSAVCLDSVKILDGKTETVSIRISDYSYETDYGITADGILEKDGRTYQVRVYLDPQPALSPGTVLEGAFRFRFTIWENQKQLYHAGKGVFLLAYQDAEITVTENPPQTLREKASVLRQGIETILCACFPEDTLPFARALLLGETGDLSYETDTALKISGIRHVAAVSGLHVSLLFALLTAITFRKRFVTAAIGFPMLVVFAAVAGFSPSVNRACMMSALMLLSLLVDQEYDRATALSFAALVMLLANPLVIASISFQLSVASVAGILLFELPIREYLLRKMSPADRPAKRKSVPYWFAYSVSVTLSAMSLTTPLCAWYFGTVSLIGVITNLLCLWVISVIFSGLVGVCLLFLCWETGGVLLAKLLSILIRYVLFVASLLTKFPLAAVYTESVYICAWLVFVYVLLGVFLLSRDKKPGVLLCCASLGLCFALLASWLEPMCDDTRITMLDVGQGQCILLQSEGKSILVDCGGDSDTAAADLTAQTLLSRGISKLDGIILTHLDRDHAGAVKNLLSRMDAELLILPPVHTELAAGENVVFAGDDLQMKWGKTVLTVYAADFPGSSNESSLCILFDTEKCDILITGDRSGFGERMLLRSGNIPDVDILVAGHHGSQNATCEELLLAVKPELVCISAGEGNAFGHPDAQLLQRLRDFGCTVYRTDQHGTITIRR